jgi:hypothetical protein
MFTSIKERFMGTLFPETERLAGPDMYIRNEPPFLTDLLADLRKSAREKTESVLKAVFSASHQHEYDRSFLVAMMQRKSGDPTGLVHLLIGRSHSPKETKKIFQEEKQAILSQLDQPALAALEGGKADWKTVQRLYSLLQQTVYHLRTEMNPGAMQEFYDANQRALERLYADERRKRALAAQYPKISQELMDAQKPTIIYSEKGGKVYQEYLLPTMPKENQDALKVVATQSPPKIFLMLGKLGQPLVRAVAEATEGILKDQRELLVKKYMQESLIRAQAETVHSSGLFRN